MDKYIIIRDSDGLYYDAIEDTFSHSATIFDNSVDVIRVYYELKRFHFVRIARIKIDIVGTIK